MKSKCFLFAEHVFELIFGNHFLRCERCCRRWTLEGKETVPEKLYESDPNFKTWAQWEAHQNAQHGQGTWDLYSAQWSTRGDNFYLIIEDLAIALAQAIIKKNGWKIDPSAKSDHFQKERDELTNYAKNDPEGFLSNVFGR